MTEINELEGEELARAVGEAQDWVLHYMWFTVDEDGKQYATRWSVDDYRPDRDIAQAWELVTEATDAGDPDQDYSEGWGYKVAVEWMPILQGYWQAQIGCCTATAATAPTAICRAYLKAKEGA